MTHARLKHLISLLLLVFSVLATVKVITSSSEGRCECTDQLSELPTVHTTFSSSSSYFCGSDLNRLAGNTSSCINDRLYLCSTGDNSTVTTSAAANIGRCPQARKRSLNGCNDSFKSSRTAHFHTLPLRHLFNSLFCI